MPQYGLMYRSLRDPEFFAQYKSRRTRGSIDEYAGFPNALAVPRALNAIQDAARRHLDSLLDFSDDEADIETK
eukprot:4902231-Pleurochrysis_carterae.AAC.1